MIYAMRRVPRRGIKLFKRAPAQRAHARDVMCALHTLHHKSRSDL